MDAGDETAAGGEEFCFGLTERELKREYNLNRAEAARLQGRFDSLAELPQAVAKRAERERAAFDEGLAVAANKAIDTAGCGILAAVELGIYLLELKARAPRGTFSSQADRLVPRIGRSMRAKSMKLAKTFMGNPDKRLAMWAAGSVRAAIDVAYHRGREQGQDASSGECDSALVAAIERLAVLSGGATAEKAAALLDAAAGFMEHASRGVPKARPRSVAARSMAVLRRRIVDDTTTLREVASRLRTGLRRPNPKASVDTAEMAGERATA